MNNNTMELNMNEMEQVNGGVVWAVPFIVLAIGGVYTVYRTCKEIRR